MHNLKPRIFMKVEKPSSNTPCDFESLFPNQLYTLYRIYVTYQAYDLMEVVFDNTYNPKENLCTQLDKKKCTHTQKKTHISMIGFYSYDHVLDLIIQHHLILQIYWLLLSCLLLFFFRIMANKNLKRKTTE